MKKQNTNPRGAGRKPKYKTDAERRAARLGDKKRYNDKIQRERIRVVAYLNAAQNAQLDAICAREQLPSKAAAVRWFIAQHAAD